MNQLHKQKIVALLRREIQEYRNSFVFTPLVVAALLIFFMLASVVLANRITVVGDSVMDIIHDEHGEGSLNITISIDDDAINQNYTVKDETPEDAELENWNFSQGWSFNPPRKDKPAEHVHEQLSSLNPVMNALHCLFLLILLFTSGNYLLGTFHQDRRDRSVLFWKSLPVSEEQEVAAKMATVCLVAPGIYIAVSVVTQLVLVLLGLLMVWRLDMSPVENIIGNLDFLELFRGQLSGWLIWVLWTLPLYAWLLLSSSAAKRSPLMFAVAIPLGLVVLEQLFIGSSHVVEAISHHIPHLTEENSDSMGFYVYEPSWLTLDYLGMLMGLAVAACMLGASVWLRRHRFEV